MFGMCVRLPGCMVMATSSLVSAACVTCPHSLLRPPASAPQCQQQQQALLKAQQQQQQAVLVAAAGVVLTPTRLPPPQQVAPPWIASAVVEQQAAHPRASPCPASHHLGRPGGHRGMHPHLTCLPSRPKGLLPLEVVRVGVGLGAGGSLLEGVSLLLGPAAAAGGEE